MMFLKTNPDARNTEGIGAMVQYQMFCYCLAKHLDVKYIFEGFKNLTHWQYYNITQEKFNEDVNLFFNFPSESVFDPNLETVCLKTIDQNIFELKQKKNDIIVEIDPSSLMKYGQSQITRIERNEWLKQLSPNCIFDSYNQKDRFNIAIHIRKYTQTDCDPSPIRDLYDISKKHYYINLIQDLNHKFENEKVHFHIFSQGMEQEFLFLKQFPNLTLHIEEYPLISLQYMINSNVFVMANSSLSYVASLYRNNITYKKHNFYHATYSNNVYEISPKGKIQ